ncbi:MAG: replisome organizer [Nitrososphaerota archaeon]
MAERRMFAKTIIDSDAFLEMPSSTQNLYFHLGMRADDDGFLNNPKKIQRMINASDDDLKVLFAKNFLIPFESGIVVIKHWRLHNYLRSDRYKPTVYRDEMEKLAIKENGAYTYKIVGIPDVDQCETQVRLGKDSIELGKDSNIDDKSSTHTTHQRFKIPTVEEVRQYCEERHNGVNPDRFIDFYASKGWLVGKSPMKDWRAAVRTWEPKDKPKSQSRESPKKELLTCPVCGNIPEQEKCDKCGFVVNYETVGDWELIKIYKKHIGVE